MTFGDRLRWARKRKGMSQAKLGELLAVSDATVNRYERGVSEPSLDMVRKLADILDVSVEFLLGSKQGPGSESVLSDEEIRILETVMSNPDLRLMFKDLQSAPEERIRDLIALWKILNRDQGNKKAPKGHEGGI